MMKKSLIALAVMAASSSAFAAATVYGQARVALTDTNTTSIDVGSQASRIGVKGSEDLGGGMSAVYGMEWGVDLGGIAGFTDRNAFVGLKGGFGTVLGGRHDTPYKLGGSADVFADTVADSQAGTSGIIGRNGLDNRANNAIAYISPDWNGFHFAVAGVTRDANTTGASTLAATSATAVYVNGPLKATLSQEAFKDAQKGTKFNIGYKIGDIGLGYTYEQSQRAVAGVTAVTRAGGRTIDPATGIITTHAASDAGDTAYATAITAGSLSWSVPVAAVTGVTAGTSTEKDKAHLLSVTYGMGPITLAAQYGKFDAVDATRDVKRTTAGVVYSLSKATNVAVAYTRDDLAANDTNGYTVQLNHSF